MERNDTYAKASSLPDALIAWTTASALIAFGIIFFNDAVIMGRTILALGILSAVNEALKLSRLGEAAPERSYRVRVVVAVAYVMLVLIGFISPGAN